MNIIVIKNIKIGSTLQKTILILILVTKALRVLNVFTFKSFIIIDNYTINNPEVFFVSSCTLNTC